MSIICPHCHNENIAGADTCEECQQDLRHESLPKPTEGLQKRIMSDSISHLNPSQPVLVRPETSALEAIQKMQEQHLGSALIVNEEGTLVGIFTDQDVLQKVGFNASDLADLPIHTLMTLAPITLKAEDSIAFALNKMSVGGFRHIPIVKRGKPMGIVTVKDLFHYLCSPEQPDLEEGPA